MNTCRTIGWRARLAAATLVLSLPLGQTFAAAESYQFSSDIPGLREPMLSADFWSSQLQENNPRLTAQQIVELNRDSLQRDPNLHDLDKLPARLSRSEVIELVRRVSTPASSPRYFADSGEVLTDADYARWEAAMQLQAIPGEVETEWGLVVQRASMRSYPTHERVLKQPQDIHLDRFQETAVFPGQRLAILHRSGDGNWLFAVNYHYAAWVPALAVAVGDRADIQRWHERGPRLVVTGARAYTNYNPQDPRSSSLALDMGVSLPLLDPAKTGPLVNGQNAHASYIVQLPLRRDNGGLEFSPALVSRSSDVAVGHLPYTGEQLLQQAFKFLGERYGWGNDYNGRDCTGFVGDVYKSFGILMPRNSGQQGASDFAPTRRFERGDTAAVLAALDELRAGDLIYIPGHVMMYLGRVAGEPWVIHDVTGLSYFTQDGEFYRGALAGVSVTPLLPLQLTEETSFVDRIYAIKRIATGATQ